MGGSWKVAYADFVTAMMAFFLLMWVLNMVPPETKAGLADYFSGEGTFETSTASPVSNNPFVQQLDKIDTRNFTIAEIERSHYAIARKLKDMLLADGVAQSSSGISADDVGVLLRVNSDTGFEKGSAVLSETGLKIMEDVLSILNDYNLFLVARGHADDLEVDSESPYPSAWELSGARAAAVARYLVENGVKPSSIRAVGYADTRPLEPGVHPEALAKNRRVEFYFHRPEVMSYGVVY